MKNENENYEKKEPIIDTYFNIIKPKIKELDIILKEEKELPFKYVSSLLDIDETELLQIMKKTKILKIKPENFLAIMLNGSSFICQILKRELECGSPYLYTPEEISYIYNIDKEQVSDAFSFLDLKFVTSNQIPTILIQIN